MNTSAGVKIKPGEQERLVKQAWIFDVDGVLTHPSEKKVTEPELFSQLIYRLEAGEPVVLNTGRALDFILEKIIKPLEESLSNQQLLYNFFAVGEKGAAFILYNNQGERVEYTDQDVFVSKSLQTAVQQLVEEKFKDVAFYDQTKKTMISVEMLDGLSVEKFRNRQGALDKELTDLLVRRNLAKVYKLDSGRIATDVENKQVGKGLGAQRALWWLNERKIKPERFITFGDSPSDAAMAAELHQRGWPVDFIFVGEKNLLADIKLNFPVFYTAEHCERGTLEYLRNLED